MPKYINRRLRLKITTKTTILYTFIFLIISTVTVIFVSSGLRVSARSNAATALEGYFAVIEDYIAADETELINNLPIDVIITDGSGAYIANTEEDFRGEHSFGELYSYSNNRIIVARTTGGRLIYLRGNIEMEMSAVNGATLSFVVMIPVGLAVMAALGSIASSGMLKPIVQMTETIKSISTETLGTRIDSNTTQDELNELKDKLNDMLEELEGGFLAQARFVSDASHELRTPISVVQGYANLLRRWGKSDPQMLDEAINAIAGEAESMKNMVDKLLFLAKADKLTLKAEPLILSEVVEEVVKETQMIATDRQIVVDLIEPLEMLGDRSLIKQAIRVFVDNAIKYTEEGGVIRIGLEEGDDGRARIKVEDNGIGIPAVDLPNIFERFYRCDVARKRNQGSTGLGLSIAKWIIEAHGGAIIVTSEENVGTKFLICFNILTGDEEE